jgi:hypothetical protein
MTRREALARIGGAAMGSALAPRMLASELPQEVKSARPAAGPRQDKPNILWITVEGVPLSVLV